MPQAAQPLRPAVRRQLGHKRWLAAPAWVPSSLTSRLQPYCVVPRPMIMTSGGLLALVFPNRWKLKLIPLAAQGWEGLPCQQNASWAA